MTSNDRPATPAEIATLKAIEAVIETHASETAKILASTEPTAALQLALADSNTAQALYALDAEGLTRALEIVESAEDDHIATVRHLHDLGHGDDVTKGLHNVVLKAMAKNTATPVQMNKKIAVGQNRSPMKFNGATTKRGVTKSFNDTVDAPQKSFAKVVNDGLNINPTAKSILREAMMKKADGRLLNPTAAAATITIPQNRIPNQERNATTKFIDDEDTLEGTWSAMAKKEAGRMKGTTPAAKTVEIPQIRLDSFKDTQSRLPPEFQNPKEIPDVIGMVLTDLPKPNVSGRTRDYVFPDGSHFPNKEKQFDVNLRKPKKPAQQFDPVNGAI
jgi:hypothetical protein